MLVISISVEDFIEMEEVKKSTTTPPQKEKKNRENRSKRLAIIGLILTIFPPAGFIVSIIAGRKSALHGKPSLLAAIGTIVNAILLVIITIAIVTFYRNGHYVDPRAKDPVVSDQITFATMKKVNSEIHRYIDEKRELPYKLDDLKSLENFDTQLSDARGTSLSLVWSPEGCDSMTTCKAYSLRAVGRKIHKPMEIIYDAVENRTYTKYFPEKELDQ